MSKRAIRAIQLDTGSSGLLPTVSDNEDNEDDSSSEEEIVTRRPAFAAGVFDDDDDDDQSSSSSSSSSSSAASKSELGDVNSKDTAAQTSTELKKKEDTAVEQKVEEEEENIDAILEEFRVAETNNDVKNKHNASSEEVFRVLLDFLDVKYLDFDYTMRNSLFGDLGGEADDEGRAASRGGRKGRQNFMFGPTKENWGKPPNYVGGGFGMVNYKVDDWPVDQWPYSDKEILSEAVYNKVSDQNNWFFFTYSDTYMDQHADYIYVVDSGDLNLLVMFVAHHPYCADALIQLATICYQSDHRSEGLEFLKRCLWIHEYSSLLSFRKSIGSTNVFMDGYDEENVTYFNTLSKLIHISNVAGLARTALAVSMYALSLDPLRDPTNALVCIDHFAFASDSSRYDRMLVELVRDDDMAIYYKPNNGDNDDDEEDVDGPKYKCSLVELPNLAYSYALALFRIYQNSQDEQRKNEADEALRSAIIAYPEVVGLLLQKNEVDVFGRSTRRDWQSVLPKLDSYLQSIQTNWKESLDESSFSKMTATCNAIIEAYVLVNHTYWISDAALQWTFDVVKKTVDSLADDITKLSSVPSLALLKYHDADLTVLEKTIQTLPLGPNVVDNGALEYALVIDTRRPRLLRRMQGGMQVNEQVRRDHNFATNENRYFGPPSFALDPDIPVMELFLRSFLPWNAVDGV